MEAVSLWSCIGRPLSLLGVVTRPAELPLKPLVVAAVALLDDEDGEGPVGVAAAGVVGPLLG